MQNIQYIVAYATYIQPFLLFHTVFGITEHETIVALCTARKLRSKGVAAILAESHLRLKRSGETFDKFYEWIL